MNNINIDRFISDHEVFDYGKGLLACTICSHLSWLLLVFVAFVTLKKIFQQMHLIIDSRVEGKGLVTQSTPLVYSTVMYGRCDI